jgi:hypothetical protein
MLKMHKGISKKFLTTISKLSTKSKSIQFISKIITYTLYFWVRFYFKTEIFPEIPNSKIKLIKKGLTAKGYTINSVILAIIS